MASHLLKWVHFQQDAQGRDLEFRYFRDTDGREVDFVVVDRRKPILMVECKLGDAALDESLRYLRGKLLRSCGLLVPPQPAADHAGLAANHLVPGAS